MNKVDIKVSVNHKCGTQLLDIFLDSHNINQNTIFQEVKTVKTVNLHYLWIKQ